MVPARVPRAAPGARGKADTGTGRAPKPHASARPVSAPPAPPLPRRDLAPAAARVLVSSARVSVLS